MNQIEITCPCCGKKIIVVVPSDNNSKCKDIEFGDLKGGEINEQ